MKFTLSWLKDHLDTDASLDVIVETLTRIGWRSSASRTRRRRFRPTASPPSSPPSNRPTN